MTPQIKNIREKRERKRRKKTNRKRENELYNVTCINRYNFLSQAVTLVTTTTTTTSATNTLRPTIDSRITYLFNLFIYLENAKFAQCIRICRSKSRIYIFHFVTNAYEECECETVFKITCFMSTHFD